MPSSNFLLMHSLFVFGKWPCFLLYSLKPATLISNILYQTHTPNIHKYILDSSSPSGRVVPPIPKQHLQITLGLSLFVFFSSLTLIIIFLSFMCVLLPKMDFSHIFKTCTPHSFKQTSSRYRVLTFFFLLFIVKLLKRKDSIFISSFPVHFFNSIQFLPPLLSVKSSS